MLYAAGRPFFVVDAYTRRIFSRHGFIAENVTYDCLQKFIERRIPVDAALYNEFHALLVKVGKEYCRTRRPRCGECPLGPILLPEGRRSKSGAGNVEMER